MAFNVAQFKSQGLVFGGARPSQFQVDLFLPFASNNANRIQFLVKAAQIPTSSVGSIDVGYFGRKIKLSGDRSFPDWTVSILNDEDFSVRSIMEKWSNGLNTLVSNTLDDNFFPVEYKADAIVTQYGKRGDIVRAYKFVGIFPTDVSPINLDWDSTNTIEQYDVTFAYDYWIPENQSDSVDSYSPTVAGDGVSA